ncbi:MAG: hypothetical protein AUI59_03270 [Thaumarchaeota archaeon 13_1_40CM_2_39_13_1]|nr:MAG: hypothetical protein AUI59_03270 [Thaumarchaeota archaeon 13_1_40CM_2_39_13_1]
MDNLNSKCEQTPIMTDAHLRKYSEFNHYDTNWTFLYELLIDTERQLGEFNERVPFKYNKDVFSPRLVNLLLMACTQIEALCKIFITELKLRKPTRKNGMRGVIAEIDKNGVLSNMKIGSGSIG